jgi:hypothetical protein
MYDCSIKISCLLGEENHIQPKPDHACSMIWLTEKKRKKFPVWFLLWRFVCFTLQWALKREGTWQRCDQGSSKNTGRCKLTMEKKIWVAFVDNYWNKNLVPLPIKKECLCSPLCRLLCQCWLSVLSGQGIAWECWVKDIEFLQVFD